MSASAQANSVGTLSPRTSSLKSKSLAIDCADLVEQPPEVLRPRRDALRSSWYIGVSFMNSAAAALDLALLAEHRRRRSRCAVTFVETITSLRIELGVR